MADWESRWHAVVASDVSARDGIGWEFRRPDGDGVWTVFRDDAAPFPVFSAERGPDPLPPSSDLLEMTTTAVGDLLESGPTARDEWLIRNITAALLWASREVTSWEGEEWAVESGFDDKPLAWAEASDLRTPYNWLRANGDSPAAVVNTYQDDAVFGLNFMPFVSPELPDAPIGSIRPRLGLPLVTGSIKAVEVVCDTTVDGAVASGVVTEALLHGEADRTLLIAAEAWHRDEWHLYDESVVTLASLAHANALAWYPARQNWRSTLAAE